MQDKGFDVKIDRLLAEIIERDDRDINRAASPLVPAADALVIDTSGISIDNVLKQVLEYVKEKITVV